MIDSGYWIVLSTGYDRSRPKGRRFDAFVVVVLPMDSPDVPDLEALVAERPGRLISLGMWSPLAGWTLSRSRGPDVLHERFATAPESEQRPIRAAIRLGVETAMKLALGIPDTGREPFPSPGAN